MQALVRVSGRAENHRGLIPEHTKRIALLGTPHRRSYKVKWARTGYRVFTILLSQDDNAEIPKELEENSETLARIGDTFPTWLRSCSKKTKIMCFSEEMSTGIGGKDVGMVCVAVNMTSFSLVDLMQVIPKDLACFSSYPSELLHFDHAGMCKYKGSEDENQQKVCGVLKRSAKELKDDIKIEEAGEAKIFPSSSL